MALSIQPGMQRFLVLFPLALIMMQGGAYPIAIVCFVLLTAHYWFAGETRKALGVSLLAGATGGVLLVSPLDAVATWLFALSGIPLAVMMARGWPYGRRLAVVCGVAFTAMAGYMVANWAAYRHETTVFMNARIAEWTQANAVDDTVVEAMKWSDVNLVYVVFGIMFGSVLLLSAFVLCVLDRWHRKPEAVAKRKPTGFQRMQVPDWVVWFAIAVALLWFAEDRWPNNLLRIATWNAAIGLTFVYWLNGLSILLYALSVLKASTLAVLMVFSGFIVFQGLLPMLGVFGLFDTWYDFRMRFRRLALLRGLSYRAGGRDS